MLFHRTTIDGMPPRRNHSGTGASLITLCSTIVCSHKNQGQILFDCFASSITEGGAIGWTEGHEGSELPGSIAYQDPQILHR
jgi:hypothetical protein